MTIVIAAFYKFIRLADYVKKQQVLLPYCLEQGVKGTILLAPEGINGTIAGSRQAIDSVLSFLHSDPLLADLEHKESYSENQPFQRLKVRLKKEIVTLGVPGIDPNEKVGTYVSPKEWNTLISDPEVIIIDTRNDYEVEIGTFKGAQDPQTKSFGQFPDYVRTHLDPDKHKKVAMFCTGGIRCEKASSFMLNQGFEEVYHLQGGILKYLEEVPSEESLWQGECYVFDRRVSVTNGVSEGSYYECYGCGHPISEADKESPKYTEGVCCPYCFDTLTEKKKARMQERQKQYELERKRKGDRS